MACLQGMVLVSAELKPSACSEFEADVCVLYHNKSICRGFQTVVHVGNVRQTAIITKMSRVYVCKDRLINKLQSGVFWLIFKILKVRNRRCVENLFLYSHRNFCNNVSIIMMWLVLKAQSHCEYFAATILGLGVKVDGQVKQIRVNFYLFQTHTHTCLTDFFSSTSRIIFMGSSLYLSYSYSNSLQCFDTVGWAAGRASVL